MIQQRNQQSGPYSRQNLNLLPQSDFHQLSQTKQQSHIGKTGKLRPFKCEHCSSTFTTKAGLNGHVKVVHLDMHPFRCPTCRRGFTVKELFQDHLNMHSNIKSHVCPHCYHAFTYKSSLRQHLRCGRCPKK